MSRVLIILVALVVASPGPARALNVSLGANLGLSVVHRPGRAGGIWHYDLPASAGSAGTISHGPLAELRLGVLTDDDRHELFLDGGLTMGQRGDSENDGLRCTANYQFNFFPTGSRLTPYLTGGAGLEHSGFAFGVFHLGANVFTYGGGGGALVRVPGGHGALRGELRWDWTDGAEENGELLFARNSAVAVKLGFDLWMR